MTDRSAENRMVEQGIKYIGDPGNLTVRQLASLLTKEGRAQGLPRVSPDEIRSYVDRGCPTNEDGTINFLTFGAFLWKEWRGKR